MVQEKGYSARGPRRSDDLIIQKAKGLDGWTKEDSSQSSIVFAEEKKTKIVKALKFMNY